jgi:hypothetical protein
MAKDEQEKVREGAGAVGLKTWKYDTVFGGKMQARW